MTAPTRRHSIGTGSGSGADRSGCPAAPPDCGHSIWVPQRHRSSNRLSPQQICLADTGRTQSLPHIHRSIRFGLHVRSLLRLINWMALVMVVVLGATAAHAEQPAYAHAVGVAVEASAAPLGTEHPDPAGEHAELPVHCGAAMLGFTAAELRQAWTGGSPFSAQGTLALPTHSVPLDPRPPRA